MAISGSFYGKTGNSAIKPRITWEAVANPDGNYSDLTATLSYSRKDSYTTSGHWAGSITIEGDRKSLSGHYMVITKDSDTVAITHTVRVPHNDNGSRTVTISASGSITGTTLTSTTISAEIVLEDIPRAAAIAASDGDIGSTVMVTIGKKSENHRYLVAWDFGELHGYLTENGLTDVETYTKAAVLAFRLPDDFYEQIPDNSTGLCNLICTTFLEDVQIGTPQKTAFAVRANPDRCGPVVTGRVTDTNPETLALTGDETILIRGESTARCVLEAQARKHATITHKKIVDVEVTENILELPAVSDNRFRFWVQDSRGYSTSIPVELPMIPYFTPVVRLEVKRTDAVSGNGQLNAQGTFYHDSFGAQNNSLQLRWRLNEKPWQALAHTMDGNAFAASAEISGMDYTRSHRITLEATDALHTITAQGDIQPGIPIFDWGKEDFAFHVPVWVQDVEILKELLQLKAESLYRTGDTMAGTLDMDGNALIGLPEPKEDTDAVPKAYADKKAEIWKLWKNRNPVAAYAAQTIDVPGLTACDYIWINFNALTTTHSFSADLYVSKTERDKLENHVTQVRYDKGVYVCTRPVTVDFEAETITFGDGLQNGEKNKNRMIPQFVMGFAGMIDKVKTEKHAICGTFLCGEVVAGQ